MTSLRFRNLAPYFALTFCLALSSLAWGQQTNGSGKKKAEYKPPPEVAVGTPLEVIDFKTTKKATFVGWLIGGKQVRVKMEDGKLRTFQATHVRLPQGNGSGAMPGGMAPGAMATMPAMAPGGSPMPAPAGASVTTAPPNPLAGLRTWTDSTGKFKIEASFVALEAGKVELRKSDGTTKMLPLAKLSDADRDIANSLAAALAPAAASPAPAVAGGPSSQPVSATSAAAPVASVIYPPATPEVPPIMATPGAFAVEGNVASVVDKSNQTPAAWRAPPVASLAPPKILSGNVMLVTAAPNIRDFKMSGGSMEDFSKMMRTEIGRGLVFDGVENHLWATLAAHGNDFIRCQRFDLATGKPLKPIQFDGTRRILDANSGFAVTLGINGSGESSDQIDVWSTQGKEVAHTVRGQPYAGQAEGASKAVDGAWMVDGTHVLTLGSKDALVLWKLPDFDPVYRLTAETVTLSPDRKCMFVGGKTGGAIYNPLTGDCLGNLPAEEDTSLRVGVFHRSQNKLAVVMPTRVTTFDLASGAKLSAVKVVTGLVNRQDVVGWPVDDYLVCNNRVLDIRLGLPLCRYDALCPEDVRAYYAGEMWYGFDSHGDAGARRRLFVHTPMPHAAALAKAEKLELSDTLAIKPGDKVGLQMNLPQLGNDAAGVEAAWKKMIADNGWVFSNDNPVAVLAGNLIGKSEQREYAVAANRQTVSVTIYDGSISLNMGGQSLWSVSNHWDVPFFVQIRSDQSLQDVLTVKPDAQFFRSVLVPNNIQRYAAGDAIMAASVSPEGVTEHQLPTSAQPTSGPLAATGPGAAAAATLPILPATSPIPPSIIPMPGAPPAGVPSATLPPLIPPAATPTPAIIPMSGAPPAGVPSATLPPLIPPTTNPMPAATPTASPMPATTPATTPMPLTAPLLPTLSPPTTPAGS